MAENELVALGLEIARTETGHGMKKEERNLLEDLVDMVIESAPEGGGISTFIYRILYQVEKMRECMDNDSPTELADELLNIVRSRLETGKRKREEVIQGEIQRNRGEGRRKGDVGAVGIETGRGGEGEEEREKKRRKLPEWMLPEHEQEEVLLVLIR